MYPEFWNFIVYIFKKYAIKLENKIENLFSNSLGFY